MDNRHKKVSHSLLVCLVVVATLGLLQTYGGYDIGGLTGQVIAEFAKYVKHDGATAWTGNENGGSKLSTNWDGIASSTYSNDNNTMSAATSKDHPYPDMPS